MFIKITPNFVSPEEVYQLMLDLDPKNNAKGMTNFDGVNRELTFRKMPALGHPVALAILERLNIPKEKAPNIFLIYYPPGTHNPPHADNAYMSDDGVKQVSNWTNTGIVFLNEQFEGGEIVYPQQGCTIKPKTGSMLFAPATIDYPHYTNPASDDRFVLVFRFVL